jgi:hypothetical protein
MLPKQQSPQAHLLALFTVRLMEPSPELASTQ